MRSYPKDLTRPDKFTALQSHTKPLMASPTAMEAVAVHPAMVVLFIVLLILCVAIIRLGSDLLRRERRRVTFSPTTFENFEERRGGAKPSPAATPDTKTEISTDFVFRRNLSRQLLTPAESAIARPVTPPATIAFHTIQSEIRAALEAAAAQETGPVTAPAIPLLNWTEPGRLAVLSLGESPPEAAWTMLKAQGVDLLIIAEDHMILPPNGEIELLVLTDLDEATLLKLIAALRARLAKGGRIAFYTETGLTGGAALLAARLSTRASE